MGTILTGWRYLDGGPDCTYSNPLIDLRYNLYEEPRDIFVKLAEEYALAGSGLNLQMDLNPPKGMLHRIPYEHPLCAYEVTNTSTRSVLALSIAADGTVSENNKIHVENVFSSLGCYKTSIPLVHKLPYLILNFSKSAGLVRLLFDRVDLEKLEYGLDS